MILQFMRFIGYEDILFQTLCRNDLWVMAEGVIYKDSWSEELLYDQHEEPISLRGRGGYDQRIIAVDYGTTNPMVFLEIYDDGKLFWVTREYYWDSAVEMRQKTDAEYADDLAKFIGPGDGAKVLIDPSAASFKAEMLKRGIWYVDADNEVNEGIRITSMVLNQRLVRFCRQTAPKTIQEMQTYAWDAKAARRRKTFENTRSRSRCVSILRQERSSLLEAELRLDTSTHFRHWA
jgi:hypothetical protein